MLEYKKNISLLGYDLSVFLNNYCLLKKKYI